MTIKTSKKFSKPAPYLVQQDSYPIRAEAAWLRNTFGTLLAPVLPDFLVNQANKFER
ncbi:MAG: hypothetical protein H6Q20_341 [Bacteroidetes bacterium]|nr:hypothetical protein [Bacteroidota bacterium]